MVKELEYPLYELLVDDAVGIYAVALVDRPAMLAKWQTFSEQDGSVSHVKFAVTDNEQRKVLAPLCRADFPIYRRDEDGNEFYVYFSRETVDKMVRLMLARSLHEEINVEHRNEFRLDGVLLNQIYLKDVRRGINPAGFEYVEDGSAFAEYKIESDEVWQAVKDGVFNGISLEGYFNAVPVNVRKPEDDLEELLKQKR